MTATRTIIAVTFAATAFLACGKTHFELAEDAQLILSVDSVVVSIGEESLLSATVLNASGPPEYVSRDQSVATVTANGGVRGAAAGSTYVVAMLPGDPSARDSVRVRVLPPPASGDPCPASRPDFGVATEAERALFAYDVNAPLNVQKIVQSTTTAFELSNITYDSPAGGSVTGIMTVPVGRSGLRPGMVILHPSGNTAQSMAPYAQQLAAHGAVAIVINAPYWRRGETFQILLTDQDRHDQIQLIKDLQRAVDVLIGTGRVDAARIGFEGYSYGGIVGAGFVGIERRLKAAVLAAPHGGWVTHLTAPPRLALLPNLPCSTRSLWFQAMTPIESIRFIPNAAPTALLFQAGRFDTAVLPADTQTLYDAASAPKEIRWYETGHGLNPQAMMDRHDWLHQQIGIDPRAAS